MPSNCFELEACKFHYGNTNGLLWKNRGKKMGVLGLALKKTKDHPYRTSENAILEHR